VSASPRRFPLTLRTMARININMTSDIEGKNQYVEESLFCSMVLQTFLWKPSIISLP
jgi:hypothetical protein